MGKEGVDSAVVEVAAPELFPLPKTVGAVATSTDGVKLGAAGVLGTDSSSRADSALAATTGLPAGEPSLIVKCCDEIMD